VPLEVQAEQVMLSPRVHGQDLREPLGEDAAVRRRAAGDLTPPARERDVPGVVQILAAQEQHLVL
jgi:hypothetical protein